MMARQILASAGVSLVATRFVTTADAAVAAADAIGYPVQLSPEASLVPSAPPDAAMATPLPDALAVHRAAHSIFPASTPGAGAIGLLVQAVLPSLGAKLKIAFAAGEPMGRVITLGPSGHPLSGSDRAVMAPPPFDASEARTMVEGYLHLAGDQALWPLAQFEALAVMLETISKLVVGRTDIASLILDPVLATPDAVVAAGWSMRMNVERRP